MRAADFVSTPDDLLAATIQYCDHFEVHGWVIEVEPFDLAYPRTPVVVVTRDHTTRVIEVQSALEIEVVEEWARYCKSCPGDTRIVVCLTGGDPPDGESIERLRATGIGLMLIGQSGPFELVPPIDLALGLELPEVPAALRPTLGAAYDLIHKGEWRDGFEHACTKLEQVAREYLIDRIARGGAQFVSSDGQVKQYAEARIKRMPLGPLADVFAEMRSPNQADSRLGQSLKTVNEGRITAAHFKGVDADREKSLRDTVARSMFVVVNGLSYARGLK